MCVPAAGWQGESLVLGSVETDSVCCQMLPMDAAAFLPHSLPGVSRAL
jgi:hypothetical protein